MTSKDVRKAVQSANSKKINVRDHDRKGTKRVPKHKRNATKSEKDAIVADTLLKQSQPRQWQQKPDRTSDVLRDLDSDPSVLADKYSVEDLVKAAEQIGNDMERTTEKVRGAAKDMKDEADAIDRGNDSGQQFINSLDGINRDTDFDGYTQKVERLAKLTASELDDRYKQITSVRSSMWQSGKGVDPSKREQYKKVEAELEAVQSALMKQENRGLR